MPNEEYKRVLVVDDDPTVRSLLATVFRQHALTIDEAADGQEAIELLREHRYSVILLDLLMPVLDGFAVIEALRTEELQSSPVVLVLTGADRQVIEQLDAQHIHGIVKKPFDPTEIAALVVACTEVRSRSTFETMAMLIGTAPLLAWLGQKF
jgi:CheY-like chemotaxis protein